MLSGYSIKAMIERNLWQKKIRRKEYLYNAEMQVVRFYLGLEFNNVAI